MDTKATAKSDSAQQPPFVHCGYTHSHPRARRVWAEAEAAEGTQGSAARGSGMEGTQPTRGGQSRGYRPHVALRTAAASLPSEATWHQGPGPLWVTASHCGPLTVTVTHCRSLPITAGHCRSLPVTVG